MSGLAGLGFAGRTVVVTGAAGGQGRAEALVFAQLGATVHLVDVADLDDALGEVQDLGGEAWATRADISTEAGWEQVAAEAQERSRPADVLVNNAGVMSAQRLTQTSAAAWQHVLGVNLVGPALGIASIGEAMAQRRRGCIVNVGSIAAFGGFWGAAYSVSKWALRGLTQVAAAELGPYGVRTVCVHPGIVESPMVQSNDITDAFVDATPLGRAATPEEIAGVVVLAASDLGGLLNGTDLVADGGCLAAAPFRAIRQHVLRSRQVGARDGG